MAPAINSVGNPQVPLANTFQPGQNDTQVRTEDGKKKDSAALQAGDAGAVSARPKQADSQNTVRSAANGNKDHDSDNQKRGALVDITV